jgi:hypothetical protein
MKPDYDEDEEALHIDDEDGDTDSDSDICDRCDCPRGEHEDGKGECNCGRCKKYKSPY